MDGAPGQCALPLRQPVDSLRFTTVATGVNHSCAITTGGVRLLLGLERSRTARQRISRTPGPRGGDGRRSLYGGIRGTRFYLRAHEGRRRAVLGRG